ncbi:hypothetical protein [Serinicoccus sediminis]|uniref:hypothetical protein n=1 Tax=Serinicoccus sediminis TaxID=2306021 RepID=UPI00102226E6|nr:hypothetical protein [Serinicoccus sediminis]
MDEHADEADEALREAVSAVYAVPPAEFVATRKEWVARLRSQGRRDLATQVGALRKPSVSAAAVNALVRAEDPAAERLREVGARLRHAQSAMDVTGLQELRAERDTVLADWVAAARRHAPAPLTAGGESEVRDTGVAALAGADATEVVLGGTLTRALAYSGFGEVDVADAVARTSTGVVLTRIEGGGAGADAHAEERDEAGSDDEAGTHAVDDSGPGSDDEADAVLGRLQEELENAEAQVGRAREARKQAAAAAGRRQDELDVARSGVEQARRLLAQAEQHEATAQERADAAQEQQEAADQDLDEARAARDEARRRLEEAQDAG